jgi:hypothetical protein
VVVGGWTCASMRVTYEFGDEGVLVGEGDSEN